MENGKREMQDGKPNKVIKAKKKESFRLTDLEYEEFIKRLNESHVTSKTEFIKAAIFDKKIKVVLIDKDMHDFHMRLTTLHSQFRGIGVNYNQIVKQLNTHFSEKRALSALKNLENLTIDLIKVNTKITELADSFEKKWLQK